MSRFGHVMGMVLQITVMGSLLFLALFRLAGMVGGARVFQYEGF